MFNFHEDQMLHLKDKWLSAQTHRDDIMFKLDLKNMQERCYKSTWRTKAWLWNLLFGHLHYDKLKELGKKKIVHGLPNMDYVKKFCEHCVHGKQAMTNFQKKTCKEISQVGSFQHM